MEAKSSKKDFHHELGVKDSDEVNLYTKSES